MTTKRGSEWVGAIAAAQASVLRVAAGSRYERSGTAWSESLIATTAYALPDEGELAVGLADGSRIEATLVGRDPGTDVALLRVGAALTAARFRDAHDVQVGEMVIGLGRPGRVIRASLRMIGVVARDVATDGGTLAHYVETDRAIPRGFTGGPVIDADGAALGIQSRALVRGADLVIPSELLRATIQELEAHGKVRAGFLGVSVRPVRLPDQAHTQLKRRRGALVLAVAPGSPAEAAGLHLGDVLLELDGEKLASGWDLVRALRSRFDRAVPLLVWRAGSAVTISATPVVR